jgi:ribonuclease R
MSKEKLTSLDLRILEIIAAHKGPNLDAGKLARMLDFVEEKQLKKLEKALIKLVAREKLTVKRGGVIQLAAAKTEHRAVEEEPAGEAATVELPESRIKKTLPLIGRISINRYGTGFVTIEGRDQDIRVPQRWLDTAMNGDEVEISLEGPRGKQEGRVKKIVSRSGNYYTGVVDHVGRDTASIRSDERSSHVDFWVPFAGLNGASEGDRVVVKLEKWESRRSMPQAIIVQVLGKAGTSDAEVLSILAENQFISTFPPEVDQEAVKVAIPLEKDDLSGRLDLRDKPVFTIDPVDAKDFDDALHLERLENGRYLLGVHIADVTHYVRPYTALDVEARLRATSVYLVDRVIPMLPEALSNGICSLNPHVDRLAFSCIMEIDGEGNVHGYTIAETIIHSKFRFTYESAQEVLEGAEHPLKDDLLTINGIAKKLAEARMRAGAIDFDSPEPRFILNEQKEPVEIIIKERKDSNRLIEECMLLANRQVSIHIENLRNGPGKKPKHGFPFIYRIHDKPDQEKIRNLAEFLKPLGIKINESGKRTDAKDLQAMLAQVKGTPYENIVNTLTLRSMAKAEYGPVNIGHFGLHFEFYTHFTSPIRRYPDVLVHRLLKAYAKGEQIYTEADLADLGKHCSKKERDAQTAERDSIKLKQVEYLAKRIGYFYDGVVSGVTENGLYVEMRPTFIEGMIRMQDLTDDFYVYDRNRHLLQGKRRGKKYILGQIIRVKIARADLGQRLIDLLPA